MEAKEKAAKVEKERDARMSKRKREEEAKEDNKRRKEEASKAKTREREIRQNKSRKRKKADANAEKENAVSTQTCRHPTNSLLLCCMLNCISIMHSGLCVSNIIARNTSPAYFLLPLLVGGKRQAMKQCSPKL